MWHYILIFLIYIVALLSNINNLLSKKYRRYAIVAIVLLSIIVGMQAYLHYLDVQREWDSTWSGLLQSSNKSESKYPTLVLGDSQINYTGDPASPVFVLGDEPLFLRMVDGKAQVSVAIRDNTGAVLAMIRNNEWSLALPPTVFDRNFTEDTLEVIDSKGSVVFQVTVDGARVKLAGTFYTREGSGPITFAPLLNEIQGREGTLFQYPSSRHREKYMPITYEQ